MNKLNEYSIAEFLTVKEAAAVLKVSRSTVLRLIKSGRLEAWVIRHDAARKHWRLRLSNLPLAPITPKLQKDN